MGPGSFLSEVVGAADAHAGVAGWAQAIGATGAIIAAILIANGQERAARRARIEAHNAFVDLCAGLGERAWESTRKARDILFAMPELAVSPNRLAYLGPVNRWKVEMEEIAAGLAAIPRDEVRDPTLAFHLAQLLQATDLSPVLGYALAHQETARDTLNMQEIRVGAAVEGIRARGLRSRFLLFGRKVRQADAGSA